MAACNLPLKATRAYKGGSKEAPGQLVIINLQKTQVGCGVATVTLLLAC